MIRSDKKNNDVLANILQGSHSEGSSAPGIEELTSVLEKYTKPLIADNIPKKRKKSRPQAETVSPKPKTRKKGKRKTTHYLTKEVFQELDQANNFLKGLLPTGSKLLSTKSKIVNQAVKMLLEDFESKGEQSELVQKLLKDNKE
ncbi:MAG: hypothetical protein KQH63_13025 [Desulfobulbaceae bacterium]|nr:hypothetical protein [Desulfobulbaceae bacterium]